MRTGEQSRRHGAVRLIVVLIACGGLVLMHQMGGSSHRMTMPGMSVQMAPMTSAPAKAVRVLASDAPAGSVTIAARVSVGAADAMCVAVLLGLLLIAMRRTVRTVTLSTRVQLHPRYGSTPLRRGPPRLLLAQICVLRT